MSRYLTAIALCLLAGALVFVGVEVRGANRELREASDRLSGQLREALKELRRFSGEDVK